ncbi:hypothetical protein L0666_03795 [Octadecabacter sp. CECT 8868]|uniref:hypothetical protein n=1 Tax=Octadecabacter algicola TaxID=2909342 RepID=UPI001F1F5E72|nr:hypothetical protein [Octadecabacter algicola]MCF2904100.1 hypothetical protein [Octadecabacter algicola]
MSDTVTKLAAKLAEDVVEVQDATGESRLFIELGAVIGSASQTLEEAFMTEVRIRLAERVARKYLDNKIAELSAKATSQT